MRGRRVRPSKAARPIELLIFDLDGTLADTRGDLMAAVNYAMRRLELPPLPLEQVCRYVGDGVQVLLSRVLGPDHQAVLEPGIRFFREYYADHLLDQTRLYPGVRETLEHFREKRKAIVTNKPLGFTEQILEGLSIAAYFQVVLGGDSTLERKPHPEAAQKVLAMLDVAPGHAVMVGDSPADIEMAKQAGLTSVAVTYGLRSAEELKAAAPDLLLSDFRELQRYFV